MKRKINLVGSSTLTVSLPSSWARERHLKKGDEVNLIINGKDLIMSSEGVSNKKTIELDVSEFGDMTKRVVGALYKAGFDEITLTFKDAESLKLIHKGLSIGFFGLDLVYVGKNHCVLKEMSEIRVEELHTSIRRVFRLISDNVEEAIHAMRQNDFEELKIVASKDANVNKFADFSRRLINKHGYPDNKPSGMVYYIVEELENIGDKYRDLAIYISEQKMEINEDIIKLFQDLKLFLDDFQDMFYAFKPQKYCEFGKKYKLLLKKIHKLVDSSSTKEVVVIMKLESILNASFDLNGPLMTLQF